VTAADSLYSQDSDTGETRERALYPPLPDDEVTRLREEETADRYRRADLADAQRQARTGRASR
jgi:hypothetical protein